MRAAVAFCLALGLAAATAAATGPGVDSSQAVYKRTPLAASKQMGMSDMDMADPMEAMADAMDMEMGADTPGEPSMAMGMSVIADPDAEETEHEAMMGMGRMNSARTLQFSEPSPCKSLDNECDDAAELEGFPDFIYNVEQDLITDFLTSTDPQACTCALDEIVFSGTLGGDCTTTTNDQDGHLSCSDAASVVAADSVASLTTGVSVTVTVGGDYSVTPDVAGAFSGEVTLEIHVAADNRIQTITFDPSCDERIVTGDTFGSLEISSIGCPDAAEQFIPPRWLTFAQIAGTGDFAAAVGDAVDANLAGTAAEAVCDAYVDCLVAENSVLTSIYVIGATLADYYAVGPDTLAEDFAAYLGVDPSAVGVVSVEEDTTSIPTSLIITFRVNGVLASFVNGVYAGDAAGLDGVFSPYFAGFIATVPLNTTNVDSGTGPAFVSSSASASPSASPSPSPSHSPISATPSPSPSASPSNSPSPSASPSNTPSPTASPSNTPSPSASPSVSRSPVIVEPPTVHTGMMGAEDSAMAMASDLDMMGMMDDDTDTDVMAKEESGWEWDENLEEFFVVDKDCSFAAPMEVGKSRLHINAGALSLEFKRLASETMLSAYACNGVLFEGVYNSPNIADDVKNEVCTSLPSLTALLSSFDISNCGVVCDKFELAELESFCKA